MIKKISILFGIFTILAFIPFASAESPPDPAYTTSPDIKENPRAGPIRYAGEIHYDSNAVSGRENIYSQGYAVHFFNADPITIRGIRIYGCKFGANTANSSVTVAILDDYMDPIYKENVSYDRIPLNSIPAANDSKFVGGWAEIPIPNVTVNQNFFVAVFAHSTPIYKNDHGMRIGYSSPSTSYTSHLVSENPIVITDSFRDVVTGKEQRNISDRDWKIRIHYAPAIPAATPTVPIPATHQSSGLIVSGGIPLIAVIGCLAHMMVNRRR